jgi:hypothetical protein
MQISTLNRDCDLCVTEDTAEIGYQNNSKAGEIAAEGLHAWEKEAYM